MGALGPMAGMSNFNRRFSYSDRGRNAYQSGKSEVTPKLEGGGIDKLQMNLERCCWRLQTTLEHTIDSDG